MKYGLLLLPFLSSAFLFFFSREMYLVRMSTSDFFSMIINRGFFEKKNCFYPVVFVSPSLLIR